MDSSSHSFTAVFRMNRRPSQGNVFLHSAGNMYDTNAAFGSFELCNGAPSAADRDDANGSRVVHCHVIRYWIDKFRL